VEAVEDQVVRLLKEELADVPIVIVGDHPNGCLLASRLVDRRARVTMLTGGGADACPATLGTPATSVAVEDGVLCLGRESAEAGARLGEARQVVVWTQVAAWFGTDEIQQLQAGSWLLDAGIGAISPEGLDEAHQRGVLPVRVNIWPALAAALLAAHESARVCQTALGWETLAGHSIVAGGALGRRGDVVVDSVHEPTRVVGVADGRGSVRFDYSPEEAQRVREVSQEIQRRLVTRESGMLD
jgi:hypothetical protein